ncbi:plasmodesmata-located protein 8 isoform X2 [Carex rostrata]
MLCFLYIITTLLSLTQHHQQAFSTNPFVYAGCSPAKFQENTQYQTNLYSFFSSIATTASHATYNSFTTGTDSPPGNMVYGLFQCRGDLDTSSCASCIQNAVAELSLVCADAFSASLQLDTCFIRYSNNNFLGQNDTTLAYRRCSTKTSNDGDFLRKRDDVLAILQSGNGFQVTSSGSVQGYSQCIGDLAASHCTTCLAEAVNQLRNSCGSAKAADVYLAQCYARYWASGYYFHAPAEYSGDDIGRTVAIIVGVLAGLALFVVFISFFKRKDR